MNIDKHRLKFIEEATDNIDDLEDALLKLEKSDKDPQLVERVFRAMHSLKGGGAMFGFSELSYFTHHMESIYDSVRSGTVKISKDLISLTLESTDLLRKLLAPEFKSTEEAEKAIKYLLNNLSNIEKQNYSLSQNVQQQPLPQYGYESNSKSNHHTYHIHFKPNADILKNGTNPLYLLDEICSLGKCEVIPFYKEIPELALIDHEKCYIFWEIFLSTDKTSKEIADVFMFVDNDSNLSINKLSEQDLFHFSGFRKKIEELALTQNEFEQNQFQSFIYTLQEQEIQDVTLSSQIERNFVKNQNISSIRVDSNKIDELMNLVSELVITQARLSLYTETSNSPELEIISENIQKITRQLRDTAFSISLIPLSSILTRFQRLARDLSAELGKEIEFITEGTETEFDKTIIENITDPILHIIRNCIDHGIEKPEERVRKGKSKKGRILLRAFCSGPNVIIEISDDGAGINVANIRDKAISQGIIPETNNLNNKEILNLVFLPGFSTAKNVTDVSGRGVGMDVVKRKITDIRGEVQIDSEVDKGTIITIKLPLTLSIIDGLLVKISENHLIIPLSHVDSISGLTNLEIEKSFNNLIVINGEKIPFYNLREEFKLSGKSPYQVQIVVVKYENVKVGLVTDYVLGEYQAVLKSLGRYFRNQHIISGATILGDGDIALIIDTNKLISQFSNQ